jgi:hypothetical protein
VYLIVILVVDQIKTMTIGWENSIYLSFYAVEVFPRNPLDLLFDICETALTGSVLVLDFLRWCKVESHTSNRSLGILYRTPSSLLQAPPDDPAILS